MIVLVVSYTDTDDVSRIRITGGGVAICKIRHRHAFAKVQTVRFQSQLKLETVQQRQIIRHHYY